MTVDANGQGLIDFTEMFTPHKKAAAERGVSSKRKVVRADQAVPAEKIKSLNKVRERAGFNCKQVADAAGLTNNFVYRALMGIQLINTEDYEKIFRGLAVLVFKKIEDA